MTVTFLENDRFRVGVTVAYGARVISLFDKHGGREWMPAGGESADTGEDAQYRGEEAVGWDECFPTVSPWDASGTTWRRKLRDHGDLWGRPWQVESQAADALTTSYADPRFRFTRTLWLEGDRLVADYAAENLTDEPLPYLWALHALLAVRHGDVSELGELNEVRAGFMMSHGELKQAGRVSWTEPPADLPFALSEVQPRAAEFMGKFYSTHRPGGWARIGQPGARLKIEWDASLKHLGIWITYGAWPEPGGHYEVAFEPTNAPSDHVGQTIAGGYPPLGPHETRRWQVTMTVTD